MIALFIYHLFINLLIPWFVECDFFLNDLSL